MKAVVYHGPRDVRVSDVPDAEIERPTDALVRITSTNICGSDLHMYEGRTDFEPGRTLGHESMGEVVEVGTGVEKIRVGDWVVLPFNISCGFWENCERGLTNYCLTTQPDPKAAGAAYGFADMGLYGGGQAELLRVPFADQNALRLGEDAQDKENDYVMLSDIFPTGYHATEMAGVLPGDSVVIAGAGPVGLMAALSAAIKSAAKVMVVDRHPDRLRLAEQIGALAIDYFCNRPGPGGAGGDEGTGRPSRLRVRRQPSPRPTGHRGPCSNAEHADQIRPVHRRTRRGWWFRSRRSGRHRRSRPAGQGSRRVRVALAQGPGARQRLVPGQKIQPAAPGSDRRLEGQPVLDRLPRAAARGCRRGVQALRRTQPGLDQGRPQAPLWRIAKEKT